ncbi:MAG: thioesterase [Sphingobium sp.]|nr:MAG: thioesterase [Sphingobium sp.]
MTGLDEIRAMIARGKRPPMMELLDIDLTEVDRGHVVFTATPSRAVYNPIGIVHGGFAATLLDSACGLAASSATDVPMNCITLEIKIAYHAAMHEHVGPVRAIGSLLSIGKRVAFTEGRLVDADDRLYASATSTLIVSPRSAGRG